MRGRQYVCVRAVLELAREKEAAAQGSVLSVAAEREMLLRGFLSFHTLQGHGINTGRWHSTQRAIGGGSVGIGGGDRRPDGVMRGRSGATAGCRR